LRALHMGFLQIRLSQRVLRGLQAGE